MLAISPRSLATLATVAAMEGKTYMAPTGRLYPRLVTIDGDYIIDTEAPVPRWPGESFGSYGRRGGDITMYHPASGAELTAYWPDDYVLDDAVDWDAGPELILIGTPCGVFFGRYHPRRA
jgi:hypothetical protein